MSDSHDYNQQFEQQPPQYGGQQGPGSPPPPGPPPPQPMAYVEPKGKKSQALAGILSGLIPGLGNIYVGFYNRGFVQAIVFILCIVALSSDSGGEPLFGIFLGFWWFFGIIDAIRCAGAYNAALMGGERLPDMPRNIAVPSQGSKTWGVVLMAAGLVFFLHTKFDFSMYWLEEWWPIVLVAFGAWLYWKARKSEKEDAPQEPFTGGSAE